MSDTQAPKTIGQKIAAFITKDRLIKAGLLLTVILAGAFNRITFKIMQFSTQNYSYFISQLTTFVYIPVNFIAIILKLVFTNHITKDQKEFPRYKFFVMGAMDSLQGLFIVVGGVQVPGIMQNLLLQGAVPVTMLCSILFLRSRGCQQCKQTRDLLDKHQIAYTEESTQPDSCGEEGCLCKVTTGTEKYTGSQVRDMGESVESLLSRGPVVLTTSGKSWLLHLKSYYKVPQYIGAVIILAGLVVSVWPSLSGSGQGGGPPLWDLIFFLATVPMALSAVYKQIAFESVDLDVWWLNGWVAIFQFVVGLTYAPLAAVMTGLPVNQIRPNIWQGLQCVFLGRNFILPGVGAGCDASLTCGSGMLPCCDSCDGSIATVSNIAALWATLLYMGANIIYNVLLIMVIKHFDAAMMYVASTVVLPLGAVCFTVHAFLGEHARTFTLFDGLGLGVVLLGLICYRFIAAALSGRVSALTTGGALAEPVLVPAAPVVVIKPRSVQQIRGTFLAKAGVLTRPRAKPTSPAAPYVSPTAPLLPAASAPMSARVDDDTVADAMPVGSVELRRRGLLPPRQTQGYQSLDDGDDGEQ